jgi:ATP-dependent exoDNAse (exonuclease V) beta subunit
MILTKEQQQALYSEKNVLVEAGAGSGKTALFVQRYLHLLKYYPDINPRNILALTYTKKAAAECVARIQAQLPNKTLLNDSTISTIHGFCSSLLRQFALECDLSPDFKILDDDDNNFIINHCIQTCLQQLNQEKNTELIYLLEHCSEYQIKGDLRQCFRKREQCLSKKIKSENKAALCLLNLFKIIMQHYDNTKKQLNCLDYDDLLSQCATLVMNPQVQALLSTQYMAIMVDECQDTDPKQWALIDRLCSFFNPLEAKKLFIVGDSKQSIYSFRGAELMLFESRKKEFLNNPSTCDVVPLTTNFRSSQQILDILNPIFSELFEKQSKHPIQYHPLKAFDPNVSGDVSALFLKDSSEDKDEAIAIAKTIKQLLIKYPNFSYKDIAILSRQRKYCDFLKTTLTNEKIPVTLDKQKGFFQQPLVIDLFQLIKGILKPRDSLTWFSILQSPFFNRSMSYCYWLKLQQQQQAFILDLQHVSTTEESPELGFKNQAKIDFKRISTWLTLSHSLSISELLRHIIYEENSKDYKQSYPDYLTQSHIILTLITDLEKDPLISRQDILLKLEYKLSLYDNNFETNSQEKNSVTLSTIHSMKGLEFPIVIVAGCHKEFYINKSDTCIITANTIHVSDQSDETKQYRETFFNQQSSSIFEEEKRLFYVACTRAKQHLILSGLWHNKSSHSYLGFLKSLPKFNEEPQHLSFCQNLIPVCWQLSQLPTQTTLPENNKNKAETSPVITDIQKIKPKKIQTIEKLSVSKWIHKNPGISHTLKNSLNDYEQAVAGDIAHRCIQYYLNTNCSLEQLNAFTKTQEIYGLLSSVIKNQCHSNNTIIVKSHILADLKKIPFIPEFSFQVKKDNNIINGRLDAFSQTQNHSIILEIKTDFCFNINELHKKYLLQINAYAELIPYYIPNILTIDVILYSLHLDESMVIPYPQKTQL